MLKLVNLQPNVIKFKILWWKLKMTSCHQPSVDSKYYDISQLNSLNPDLSSSFGDVPCEHRISK